EAVDRAVEAAAADDVLPAVAARAVDDARLRRAGAGRGAGRPLAERAGVHGGVRCIGAVRRRVGVGRLAVLQRRVAAVGLDLRRRHALAEVALLAVGAGLPDAVRAEHDGQRGRLSRHELDFAARHDAVVPGDLPVGVRTTALLGRGAVHAGDDAQA